jgi:uncharacterized membrane protein YgcG
MHLQGMYMYLTFRYFSSLKGKAIRGARRLFFLTGPQFLFYRADTSQWQARRGARHMTHMYPPPHMTGYAGQDVNGKQGEVLVNRKQGEVLDVFLTRRGSVGHVLAAAATLPLQGTAVGGVDMSLVLCMYTHTHTCVYVHVYVCIYVCMYVRMCVCVCVCVCVCITYTQSRTRSRTHTHTHTHTPPAQVKQEATRAAVKKLQAMISKRPPTPTKASTSPGKPSPAVSLKTLLAHKSSPSAPPDSASGIVGAGGGEGGGGGGVGGFGEGGGDTGGGAREDAIGVCVCVCLALWIECVLFYG